MEDKRNFEEEFKNDGKALDNISEEVVELTPNYTSEDYRSALAYLEKYYVVMQYYELEKEEYSNYTIKELHRQNNEIGKKANRNAEIFVDAMNLELVNNPDFVNYSFKDIKNQSFDDAGKLIKGSLLDLLFKATEETINLTNYAEDIIKSGKKEKATAKKREQIKKLEYPVAKLASSIWGELFKDDLGKQIAGQLNFCDAATFDIGNEANNLIKLNVGGSKDVQKNSRFILYGIDQEELKQMGLDKQIDNGLDQRIHDIICTLYDYGYRVITASDIHALTGKTSSPNAKDNQDITKSLRKLNGTLLYVDETNDYPKYISDKYNVKSWERLIDIKMKDIYSKNGKYLETAIQLREEPVLLEFSKRRKQIEPVPIEVLQYTGSKTKITLKIENYLIRRIANMIGEKKQGKPVHNEISHKRLLEDLNVTRNKQRAIDKAIAFLDSCCVTWIEKYENRNDKFYITLKEHYDN